MPWYRFTIKLRDGSVHAGIRQLAAADLDYVWRSYERKAKDHYRHKLASFDVIQLSKLSKEVKDFVASQGKKDTLEWGSPKATVNRKKNYVQGNTLEERNG